MRPSWAFRLLGVVDHVYQNMVGGLGRPPDPPPHASLGPVCSGRLVVVVIDATGRPICVRMHLDVVRRRRLFEGAAARIRQKKRSEGARQPSLFIWGIA